MKTILPIGTKSNQFGKVIKVIYGNSYLLETLQGERFKVALMRDT
jgi:hypothetical protein